MTEQPYYNRPGRLTTALFNPLVAGLTRLGISIWGSRVLESRGRSSGQPRRVPVNLLAYGGDHYLVAPRGNAQWVRNVRADGGRLDLLLGKRREHWTGVEFDDDAKLDVLRAYLKRWKAEVGVFFDGVDANSPESELRRIARRRPVSGSNAVPREHWLERHVSLATRPDERELSSRAAGWPSGWASARPRSTNT